MNPVIVSLLFKNDSMIHQIHHLDFPFDGFLVAIYVFQQEKITWQEI